jgi:hypothetical protein
MSSPFERHVIAAALLAFAAAPAALQEAQEEPVTLPVLYYSVGEKAPDFEGEPRQLLQAYKQSIEKVDERITVSAYNQILGSANMRIHWFEALPDVFSLRFVAQAWGDSDVSRTVAAMQGMWLPGTYHETVLVPCPAEPAQAPVYKNLILVHQTALAKTAEYATAKAAAVALTNYVNEQRDDVWVQLYENLLGDFGRFHWFVRTADLASWHRTQNALFEDREFQKLFEQTFSHCVEGSLETDWGFPLVGP